MVALSCLEDNISLDATTRSQFTIGELIVACIASGERFVGDVS